jgi:hypothetical protein
VLGSSDPAGVARTLLPPIRELFRAGADVDAGTGSVQDDEDASLNLRAALPGAAVIYTPAGRPDDPHGACHLLTLDFH